MVSKPNFDRGVIYTKDFVVGHMNKTKVVYNKPTCLEMCILELSYTLMYEFIMIYSKPKYGDMFRLLMTDTYSSV